MTPLLLILALVFIGLAVVILAATRWGQGYFYENVVEGATWRATAMAVGVTTFFGLWAFLESKTPGRFDSFFNFSARENKEFDHFWSVKQGPAGPIETQFRRKTLPSGHVEYFDDAGKPWKRSDSGIITAIIIEESGDRRKFVAKLGSDGKFLRDPRNPNQVADLQYIEEDGQRRVMTESAIGRLSTSRTGAVILNLLFNLTFFILWFAGLWFLLEFQWGHAFLLAGIFWLASVTLIWPAIQSKIGATSSYWVRFFGLSP